MGHNKKIVNFSESLIYLKSDNLSEYYGSSDAIIFEDNESFTIFKLHVDGKKSKEIIELINQKIKK
jgi:hypothetical protein